MNGLKINFRLQELEKVMPFGSEPHLSLHWFGLTDGLLWIDVGTQTIYEYSEAAQQYFDNSPKYNDYQISRFLEDFSYTFRYVGESVPKEFYDSIEEFDEKMDKWQECHVDEEDDVYEKFYFDEYCELREWYSARSFDSGHLVGGPYISCFRCGDKIKILWESSFKLDNGESIWTSPKGCYEMSYSEFVISVKRFFDEFFISMSEQVERALVKDWGNISLDKQILEEENVERKKTFDSYILFLDDSPEHTDWKKIKQLHNKMESEIRWER